MDTPPVITRLGPGDAPRLEAFLRAAEGAAAAASFQAGRARRDPLDQPDAWVLLATVAGQPAGAAVAVVIPKWDARGGFAFVDELLVLPAFRRRGVASALLAHVRALAAEQGLAGVRLLVRPDNEAARRLYARLGFALGPCLFGEQAV